MQACVQQADSQQSIYQLPWPPLHWGSQPTGCCWDRKTPKTRSKTNRRPLPATPAHKLQPFPSHPQPYPLQITFAQVIRSYKVGFRWARTNPLPGLVFRVLQPAQQDVSLAFVLQAFPIGVITSLGPCSREEPHQPGERQTLARANAPGGRTNASPVLG